MILHRLLYAYIIYVCMAMFNLRNDIPCRMLIRPKIKVHGELEGQGFYAKIVVLRLAKVGCGKVEAEKVTSG